METTGEDVPASKHLGQFDPCQDRLPRIFGEFELNGSLGCVLDNGNPFSDPIFLDEIGDGEFHQIAPSQLTIDSYVEQCQIA